MKKCEATVWDNFTSRKCSRNAGHGANGLYCKQHAKVSKDKCVKMFVVEKRYFSLRDLIRKIDVVRATENSVFIRSSNGTVRRSAKENDYEKVFETWEEAHNYLGELLLQKLKHAQNNYERFLRMELPKS